MVDFVFLVPYFGDKVLAKNGKIKIQENGNKLVPIIDTVKLCHRDIGTFSVGGVGNFIELLNYRVRVGEKHFRSI